MGGYPEQLQSKGARSVTRSVPREIITTRNGFVGGVRGDNMGNAPPNNTATIKGIGESVPRLGDDAARDESSSEHPLKQLQAGRMGKAQHSTCVAESGCTNAPRCTCRQMT
jgi:hypothetical protein